MTISTEYLSSQDWVPTTTDKKKQFKSARNENHSFKPAEVVKMVAGEKVGRRLIVGMNVGGGPYKGRPVGASVGCRVGLNDSDGAAEGDTVGGLGQGSTMYRDQP